MNDLFKGYIKTDGKKSLEKLKGRINFSKFEEINTCESYAGILKDDIVLVDVDDYEESEILLKIIESLGTKCWCFETARGKHFLFKNVITLNKNKTGASLPIGIKADIKIGKNRSYEVLKLDGVERNILRSESPEELPYWLKPIRSTTDFKNLGEGDGRNQQLFNYILTLSAANFSTEQIRSILKLINKFVLKNPLDDSELDTIMRNESFVKPNFYGGPNGTTFLHAEFAKYMINEYNILKINHQLHIYKEGVYIPGLVHIENKMIGEIEGLTKSKRNEVISWMEVKLENIINTRDSNLIAFKNGIYDITNGKFVDFKADMVITNKINFNYNPEASSEVVDKLLNRLAVNDSDVRSLLEESIGYCFYRRNELGKAFILTGDGANGKSTFLDMIKTLLGEDNISSLDLGELGDRFKTAELFGKLANIGDDIGDEFIANPAIFKKLVTGERTSVERKGKDPFEFNNYSKMLFSANSIPRIKDKTGAVQRRLIIIPFDAKFTVADQDYDPYIKYKLRTDEAMEYLISLGLTGLKRVLENRKFSEPQKVTKELKEYEESNNPIIGFINEFDNEIVNQTTNDVYKHYNEYCVVNGMNPMSKIEFSKQIKKRLNLEISDKKIAGKKYRIFIEKGE